MIGEAEKGGGKGVAGKGVAGKGEGMRWDGRCLGDGDWFLFILRR